MFFEVLFRYDLEIALLTSVAKLHLKLLGLFLKHFLLTIFLIFWKSYIIK